jgi:hypothetical protein
LASALASAAGRTSAQASASMFNLAELLETTKAMAAGRVFTGYFANQSLHEPIRQDLFVFFDTMDGQATTPADAASRGKKTVAPSKEKAPHSYPGGALYWSVVARDGSLYRTRAADLSLPLSEIEDIYLGKRTTAFTLPFAAHARDECCFSLIAKNRTHMNFEAKTAVTLVSWLLGLKRLVQANKKMTEQPTIAEPLPQSLSVRDAPPLPLLNGSTLDLHDTNQSSLRLEIWQTMQLGIAQGAQIFSTAIAQQKALAAGLAPPPSKPVQQPQPAQHLPATPASTPTSATVLQRQLVQAQQQQHTQPSMQGAPPQQPQQTPAGGIPANPPTGKLSAAQTRNPRLAIHSKTMPNNPSQQAAAAFVAVATAQQPALQSRPLPSKSRSPNSTANASLSPGSVFGSGTGGGLHGYDPSVDPLAIFQILGRIGQGNYGYVYKARDLRDQTLVAIKIVEVDSVASSQELAAEINILAQCHSQYIVAYKGTYVRGASSSSSSSGAAAAISAGERKISPNGTLAIAPQQVWMVMEYCLAGSFCDLLAITDRVLSEAQIGAVLRMCLEGLAYFHSLNHLHRDLKAGNILVNEKGECKVSKENTHWRLKYNHPCVLHILTTATLSFLFLLCLTAR